MIAVTVQMEVSLHESLIQEAKDTTMSMDAICVRALENRHQKALWSIALRTLIDEYAQAYYDDQEAFVGGEAAFLEIKEALDKALEPPDLWPLIETYARMYTDTVLAPEEDSVKNELRTAQEALAAIIGKDQNERS